MNIDYIYYNHLSTILAILLAFKACTNILLVLSVILVFWISIFYNLGILYNNLSTA